MPRLAVAAEWDRPQQLDPAPVHLAFARAGPRKSLEPGCAGLQSGTAYHLEGGSIGADADGKSKQRQEADQAAAHHDHAAALERSQRAIRGELSPAPLPRRFRAMIAEEPQHPRLETSLNVRRAERHAGAIRQ